jgi:hypothetical protein
VVGKREKVPLSSCSFRGRPIYRSVILVCFVIDSGQEFGELKKLTGLLGLFMSLFGEK